MDMVSKIKAASPTNSYLNKSFIIDWISYWQVLSFHVSSLHYIQLKLQKPLVSILRAY